jgi:hypothetical protein
LWAAALKPQELPQDSTEIGCDVARFGDDNTSLFVRRGPCGLHHETHNGWSTTQTAGRLKQLCGEWRQPKSDTKKRIGRSPDDMDALNLAYAAAQQVYIPQAFAGRSR